MCDKLVFDLSQEVEGSPNVFVRKDWINILDNQNQNYSNNQSIIDTSQLSNSNKYMSYRESYLSVPMLLTLKTTEFSASTGVTQAGTGVGMPNPTAQGTSFDYSIGLKNWFGQIIHSLTLDYNGTTILQQTPFANIWNCFKLMTSLSWQDVASQGSTIGFYPDDPLSWVLYPTQQGAAVDAITAGSDFIGNGVCNNTNAIVDQSISGVVNGLNPFKFGCGNKGFVNRQRNINFDNGAFLGSAGAATVATGEGGITAGTNDIQTLLMTKANTEIMWKSHVITKSGPMALTNNALTIATPASYQVAIVATIYLKHIHSFFNMCPLLKGVFMKLTLNLNNASSTIVSSSTSATIGGASALSSFIVTKTSVPIGGVNPMMVASPQYTLITGVASSTIPASSITAGPPALPVADVTIAGTTSSSLLYNGGFPLTTNTTITATTAGTFNTTYIANISVGSRCLDTTLYNTTGVIEGTLSKSIYLYVPAYTFNPVFEQAYLSTPIKQIKYTDIYQYQIQNVSKSSQINQLVTNGIANIKSVLIVPFFSPQPSASATHAKTSTTLNSNTFLPQGMPVYQSPFDPAGCGCTSPLAHLTNFNVQISGQNAIYNLQKYGFEQFNNQLYGQNAVNGGLTDGLTSGLIDRLAFDMAYCFYYVNVERMLPVEQSVPKSVQILGQNISERAMDYWVFVEYGVEISIDSLTGARV
jgi:hypothetical protein